MKTDTNKGITSIAYNHLSLPTKVTIGGNTIDYVYDATGGKLLKKVTEGSNATVTLYTGNHVYERINSGSTELQFINHPEGYIKPVIASGGAAISSWEYVYQYKDHLGNVRLSYTDSNNDGVISAQAEIIEESNYYPFGLKHKGYNNVVTSNGNSVAQKRKFGGMELQDELNLNWYDITARNYDPALGRWMNLDPLAEQMRRHSPYNYGFDNPVYWLDPDGMMPQPPGWLSKAWSTVKNIWKSSKVSSVSIGAGAGFGIGKTKAKASVAEFEYSLESNTFSFSAVKIEGGLGDSEDNVQGEIKVAYASKNFDTDKGSGGFVRLEGTKTEDFDTKGGSIAFLTKNENGEKGAVVTEDLSKSEEKGTTKVTPPETSTNFKLKIGIGISIKFDWNKFDRLQQNDKGRRETEKERGNQRK